MRWSWRIGRLAGISVYMHVTFLVLLAWIGMSSYMARGAWEDALSGMGFVIVLFGIVVLHELGHALTARRFGIRTRDITLLPIGGVARLERMPEDPKQELLVALAGPAVNVALAALLYGVLALGGAARSAEHAGLFGGGFVERLLWVNVALAVFNMLPAFPMDGGRVLRALLALKLSYVRATRIAAQVGQGMAFLFGFWGLFANPFLILIALFVWMGAAQEASVVEIKSALGGVPVEKVMITDFRTVSPHDSLSRAVELILAGSQQDFPVVEGDHVVGVLTRADLLKGLAQNGTSASVADHMHRDFRLAAPLEPAEKALARLQNCQCRTLPVVENGVPLGILTLENIGEFLMIQSALQGGGAGVGEGVAGLEHRRAA